MPVDEEKLDAIIADLTANLEQDDALRIEKRQVRENLREIQMKPGEAQPGDTEEPAKIMPHNTRSHKPYTAAQRLTQYNDNIPKAEAYLS